MILAALYAVSPCRCRCWMSAGALCGEVEDARRWRWSSAWVGRGRERGKQTVEGRLGAEPS